MLYSKLIFLLFLSSLLGATVARHAFTTNGKPFRMIGSDISRSVLGNPIRYTSSGYNFQDISDDSKYDDDVENIDDSDDDDLEDSDSIDSSLNKRKMAEMNKKMSNLVQKLIITVKTHAFNWITSQDYSNCESLKAYYSNGLAAAFTHMENALTCFSQNNISCADQIPCSNIGSNFVELAEHTQLWSIRPRFNTLGLFRKCEFVDASSDKHTYILGGFLGQKWRMITAKKYSKFGRKKDTYADWSQMIPYAHLLLTYHNNLPFIAKIGHTISMFKKSIDNKCTSQESGTDQTQYGSVPLKNAESKLLEDLNDEELETETNKLEGKLKKSLLSINKMEKETKDTTMSQEFMPDTDEKSERKVIASPTMLTQSTGSSGKPPLMSPEMIFLISLLSGSGAGIIIGWGIGYCMFSSKYASSKRIKYSFGK